MTDSEVLYSRQFEEVVPNIGRLKVPGGWLVRYSLISISSDSCIAMTFVPDPNDEWKLKPEDK